MSLICGGNNLKIKTGFMLRNIADSWIVVPLGERVVDFNGLITLNETGAFLWKKLDNATEETLVEEMLKEYDINKETAKVDVADFIDALTTGNIIEI
jgi:hypothetical protein